MQWYYLALLIGPPMRRRVSIEGYRIGKQLAVEVIYAARVEDRFEGGALKAQGTALGGATGAVVLPRKFASD
jgi:hypothetical protein